MRVSDFDFDLPDDLIALRPATPRDASRLLVVREDGSFEHKAMCDLPPLLRAGDTLVVNDTKVMQARLRGVRPPRDTGGAGAGIEILLLKQLAAHEFSALARPMKRLKPGDRLIFKFLTAEIARIGERGEITLYFDRGGDALLSAIDAEGEIPLPPYIEGKRPTDSRDTRDYQTAFARVLGSVAAPTAGLHFTPDLLGRLAANGIARESVTLHVGAGTFLPVTAEDTADHRMHPEWAELSADAASALNATRERRGRIAAVGSTALRTLETAADDRGHIRPFTGETALFITPGYHFKCADMMLTNFHLPRSTLFMLVCAFAGTETMKAAYAAAIANRYRFYSYGDACLLFRAKHGAV